MSIELLAIGYDQRPRDSELMALQVQRKVVVCGDGACGASESRFCNVHFMTVSSREDITIERLYSGITSQSYQR